MDEKIVCFVLRRQIQNCYYSSDTTRIPPIKYDVEVRVEKKIFRENSPTTISLFWPTNQDRKLINRSTEHTRRQRRLHLWLHRRPTYTYTSQWNNLA